VAAAALAVTTALAGCGAQTGASASSGGGDNGGGGGGKSLTHVNVAVSLTAASNQAYVAAKQGFFKDNGLDATLIKVDNKTNLVEGLGHNFDFGETYPPTVISAGARGLNIEAVAGANVGGGGKGGDLDVMVAPGSKITDAKQLAGKRIGAGTVNGVTHLMTLTWLQQIGVDPNSINGIALPIATMGDQLKAGRIDAAEVTQPFISQLEAKGYKSLGDPEDHVLSGETTLTVWAANKPWAESHRDAVKGFQQAIAQATAWAQGHEDQADQILSDAIGVPVATIKSAPPQVFRAELTPDNSVAPFIAMEKKIGWLKQDISASDLVFQ
jgi:NitT/TauT family transport system substrate-binding protein